MRLSATRKLKRKFYTEIQRFIVPENRAEVHAVPGPLKAFENHTPEIREEYLAALNRGISLPQYHEIDPFQYSISARTPGSWNVLPIVYRRKRFFLDLFPKTHALLETVPDVTSATFSRLSPRKAVPPHRGPWRGILRYHLGLIVPHVNPPRLRVGSRLLEWREGESFLFDDSLEHEVINESKEERVVLIVVIIRPLSGLRNILNRALMDARFFSVTHEMDVRLEDLDRASRSLGGLAPQSEESRL